jgi:uncharacterized membrane protein
MRGAPVVDQQETPRIEAAAGSIPEGAGFARRAGAFVKREFDEIWPPTLFFIIGFNLILLTTNLILSNYGEEFATYLVATVSALVVGKVVPVVNATSLIRRYDRAPLIQPILFKTLFYWVAVLIARLIEHWIKYVFSEQYQFGKFVPHEIATFSWSRFIAIQLWIFILFLVYMTAHEFNRLFGYGELARILFTYRPSELQLNRRERIRELVRLSKLADAHSVAELNDPSNAGHAELVDIVSRLARGPQPARLSEAAAVTKRLRI